MTFASPQLLAALLLVPIAVAGYLLVQRRRSRYAVRFTNVDLLANLVPRTPAWRRHVPPVLYVAAIAALVIGLARPSLTVQVPRDEATIVLAMDVSGSMRATDVAPSRLEAARQSASDFVDQLPERVRVGLVTFSTQPHIVVTPTTDRVAIHDALNSLRADGGTALGDAIVSALDAADQAMSDAESPGQAAPESSPPVPQSSPPAAAAEEPVVATVLLSDGANSTGRLEPIEAAEEAAARGVPVYTIALGTQSGVVEVPNRQGGTERLNVPPDTETLAQVAEMTGGRFFDAPTAADLAQIYDSLGSRIGYTTEEQEVTQWFAAAGLALVLVGAGLAAHWFNRFP